ncbi:phosphomannomutase/phosphoglucomutase [bacterium]|nr:MAG: phosphomannomutase/phosphoglucomutase [bacterium]QQR61923.1 MAG: phosphomannomutase/phosphoglucomutase [bacterium]
MTDSVFREYDIRGIVGSELIVSDVYQLCKAILYYFLQKNEHGKTILIGRDGRRSSDEIFTHLCKAVIDSGLEVMDAGVIPSPVLYFGMYNRYADFGLMITASHNPADYNGIKMLVGTHSVYGQEIRNIRTYFHEKKQPLTKNNGKKNDFSLLKKTYIDFLLQHFSSLSGLTLPIVFDCAHAVAGSIIKELVKQFHWNNCTVLFDTIDGSFPAHEADPTVEKNMQDLKKTVLEKKAAIGIGFDGDADRMAAVTEAGQLLLGDTLLAVFSQTIDPTLKKRGIVINVTMSDGLHELFAKQQVPVFVSPTGHAIIKQYMDNHDAVLGGEGSCHFFFKDRYFGYDDGIYAALRLLETVVQSHKKISELATILPKRMSSKEYRIPCPDTIKNSIMDMLRKTFQHDKNVTCLFIDGIRITYPFGWAIIRPANTQPVLSMRFEAHTNETLMDIKHIFLTLLQPFLHDSITIIANE